MTQKNCTFCVVMESLNQQMLSAANAGDLATVERLVREGADINYVDAWGNFAMFSAAWEGNIPAMNFLYTLGANLEYEDANLLCNAAYNGKLDSVKWLLDKGQDANFFFKSTGENALHYTLSKNNELDQRAGIVGQLIAKGIDVNKRTMAGQTTVCFMRDAWLKGESPLHRAAAFGNTHIIQMLIDAGAEINRKDANGDTPLSWASWYIRDNEVLKLLIYPGVARIH